MTHLTKKQIDKLTYYYLKNKKLSDELLEAKRHMADCELCYEEFCVSIVAAHELEDKGLFELDALIRTGGKSLFANKQYCRKGKSACK